MAKKNDPKQKIDTSYDDPLEGFDDFDNLYEDDQVNAAMDQIFNAHFSKIDCALKLTQLALEKNPKAGNEDQVFDVFKKALKVINETAVEDTLKNFGFLPDTSIKHND